MSKEKENFTYLLGAGASAKSVPIVSEFPGKLHDFCEKMDEISAEFGYSGGAELRELMEEVKETIKHSASFDTYAKKLYLSKELDTYHSYKRAIAAYIFYNNLTQIPDRRYDLFFASLLEKNNQTDEIIIPSNINIISWNYDRLVEMSLSHLTGWDSDDLASNVNIYSNYTSTMQDYKPNRLNLIKLNGSAGRKFYYGEVRNKFNPENQIGFNKLDTLKNIMVYYSHLKDDAKHELEIQFSWEKDNKWINEARALSKEILSKTDHLIVIGYSFPTFNRMIDHDLLKSLNSNTIIHLQTKENSIKAMKQRLCALTNRLDADDSIKVYTETDEFFIPFEYNDIHNESVWIA